MGARRKEGRHPCSLHKSTRTNLKGIGPEAQMLELGEFADFLGDGAAEAVAIEVQEGQAR